MGSNRARWAAGGEEFHVSGERPFMVKHLLNSQIGTSDFVVFHEVPGLAFQVHPAFGQDIGVVADREGHGDVLLHQKHGKPRGLQLRQGLEQGALKLAQRQGMNNTLTEGQQRISNHENSFP